MPKRKTLPDHPELGLPEVRKLWQTEKLFSDHYLKARLHKNSWWPSDTEAEPIWRFCKELYDKRFLVCAKNNEAFTRQELLDKILEKLGFAWTDNLGLPDQDAEPDYILFSSAEEKERVIAANKEKRYATSVAILEAKKVILDSSPRLKVTREDLEVFDSANLCIPCYPNATNSDFRLAIQIAKRCKGGKLGDWAQSQQGEVNLTTHSDFRSNSPVGPVVLRGAHVGRYLFNDTPKQGEPKYLRVEQFLKSQSRDAKAFDSKFVRIGYQRGAAIDNWRRIIATIIEPGNFCSDTINYIANPDGFDLFAILALLNSSVWEWRFRLTSTNNHVNAYEIDGMPFPHFEFKTPEQKRVALIANSKQLYRRGLSDGKPESMLALVAEQLAAKPECADVVHDLLAFLAEQMVLLNREKRTAAKQFLTDLKDFHNIDVHDLKPKTKLDEFWKLEAADVFAHLRANKLRCTGTDEEKIRDRFQKAKDSVVPLEAQLAFTDSLIDQIVYRLYDLTPQEIKIVEDAAK